MSKCAILGASGHGKVVAEIAVLNGYQEIVFFDDGWPYKTKLEHWSIDGNSEQLIACVSDFEQVVVAIGNNEIRIEKQRQLQLVSEKLMPLVHPCAAVSAYAKLGAGTVVMAGAVVNPFTIIGEACIINTNATVDHDCVLLDGVHVSPGASLAGGVKVGSCSWIGIGAQVKQLIEIGAKVTVGAGSTVIKNISDNQVVVGSPAQTI